MVSPNRVVGVILAGGRSSRMGGGDKCLLPLAGRPVLASVIARLRPQVSDLIINANGDASRFADFGLPVIADTIGGLAGPLAGVHAGLEWVKANAPDVGFVVTVAGDTPFFPSDLVQRFLAELADHPALLVATSEEGVHPVVGLWPIAMAPQLEDSLAQGVRKVGAWTKQQGAREVFYRPEELAEADALLRAETP